ncbi:MAG: hypothetical protein FWE95_03645 [Planctomycetaceae bacterium]|nr:hypothetical protein [Planctomycetaceae bacterium]
MPIEFNCHRCQHSQTVDESKAGQQVYCQVCYFPLTVPAESTKKTVDESQLYNFDAKPWDGQERQELISFPCTLCSAVIGVRIEQIGKEIICAECGKKIIVPKSIAEMAKTRLQNKLDKALAVEWKSLNDTYSLSSGTSAPSGEGASDEGTKQFMFLCRLCGTRLFATELQVGTLVSCPDCTTKTKVPPKTVNIETAPLPPLVTEEDDESTSGSSTENLVPVICRLCGTRLYAKESQIGQFKTCPDCGQKTEIRAVPKHQKIKTSTTSADAYGISQANGPTPRPTVRVGVDYRTVEGSLGNELREERYRDGKRVSSRSFNRPQLPNRPLTERFFVPFGSLSTWLHLLPTIVIGSLGMMIIVWATRGGGGIGMFTFGLAVVVAWLVAYCYFASFLVHLYNFTSGGMDEGEFQGEIAPFDYFLMGFWLFLFSFVATLPGCFIGNILTQALGAPFLTYVMIRISHWLFFPICFLSSMESGSMLALLAKNTLVSLVRQPFAWLRFYLLTGVLFVLSDLCLVFAEMWLQGSEIGFYILFTFFFCLFAIQSLFFFRLLGRLAWLIEETDRQKRELEEEEEEEEE